MNRSNFFANRQMRISGKRANRPEQLLIAEILENHLSPVRVETEVPVKYVMENGDVREPVIDIFMVYANPEPGEYLIRVMGESHPMDDPHDRIQRAYLENLGVMGIRRVIAVIDLWYHRMPSTWGAKHKLSEDGLRLAYYELRDELLNLIDLPKEPARHWLKKSRFRK